MDANKVLAVLRDVLDAGYDTCPSCGGYMLKEKPHTSHCQFAALLAAAEHEAQGPGDNDWQSTVGMFAGDADVQAISEETRSVREAHKVEGGWNPGTEPPDTHRLVAIERSDFPGQVSTGLYLESGTRGWLSQSGSPIYRVDRWHDLPPLPEQSP